jgi:flagellar biosynthesis protein FlhG
MRPISEQDHYEILEIARDATREEIERAFRMALATYSEDSLAGYSVFGEGEAQAIRERIEIAHRVLSDAESRSAYDAHLAGGGEPVASPESLAGHVEPLPLDPAGRSADSADPLPIGELDDLDEESDDFDGARLRRSRLHRGLELEDISVRTKISPTYLRFIEEDRYADLPAPVYVRGFVTAYADCVGLDPGRVATSYMKNFADRTVHARRGRFLGGR